MLREYEYPPCHPFMKWAGGKTQLLDKLVPLMPKEINTYYEPFIGGGAVFFKLANERTDFKAKLSDVNEDLITAYLIIQNQVKDLIDSLDVLSKDYFASSDQEKFYYNIRELYNVSNDKLERIKYMIFLNKTCFNGLYRVNSSGKFNVPYGDYKKPKILDKKNLLAINQLLNNIEVDFSVIDFEDALRSCTKNDFCYLDPPYQPEQEGGFTSYTKSAFNEENQKRLCNVIKTLTENKTNVMLSNSETTLIREMYSKYNIKELPTLRAINSDATKRKGSTELVIMNYIK